MNRFYFPSPSTQQGYLVGKLMTANALMEMFPAAAQDIAREKTFLGKVVSADQSDLNRSVKLQLYRRALKEMEGIKELAKILEDQNRVWDDIKNDYDTKRGELEIEGKTIIADYNQEIDALNQEVLTKRGEIENRKKTKLDKLKLRKDKNEKEKGDDEKERAARLRQPEALLEVVTAGYELLMHTHEYGKDEDKVESFKTLQETYQGKDFDRVIMMARPGGKKEEGVDDDKDKMEESWEGANIIAACQLHLCCLRLHCLHCPRGLEGISAGYPLFMCTATYLVEKNSYT